MRIFTMIVSIVFSFALFFQSMIADIGVELGGEDDLATAAAMATLGALLWLIAGALVIAWPMVSMFIFGLASLVMIIAGNQYAEVYPDLQYWGWFGLLFVVSSYFGWRGKRKEAAEKAEERRKQDERDAMMMRMMSQQENSKRG